ncbi:MAG: hypothetical protein ACJAZ1_000078 [Yoonia sp.]|jgi:hypothetical protein
MTGPVLDFIIIGAMKCGTTTLQAQLAAQPGIFMTTPKEPNFFSDDAVYAQGQGWYRSLFYDAAPGDLKGEASTHYTKLPTYPQTVARMSQVLMAPRLIYVIRNPVTRAVSHYIHEWSEGRMSQDAIAAFASDATLQAYSHYPMQLAPFIDAFGLDAIHLTSLELMKADPDGEMAKISTHLQVSTPLVWDNDMGAQNVSAQRVRRLPLQRLIVDNPVATFLRHNLVPKAVRNRIREGRTITARPELPQELRRQLEDVFTPDRAALEALFPGHPALPLCYGFTDR